MPHWILLPHCPDSVILDLEILQWQKQLGQATRRFSGTPNPTSIVGQVSPSQPKVVTYPAQTSAYTVAVRLACVCVCALQGCCSELSAPGTFGGGPEVTDTEARCQVALPIFQAQGLAGVCVCAQGNFSENSEGIGRVHPS